MDNAKRLDELGFSTRVCNSFQTLGFVTVGGVRQAGRRGLLRIPNFGKVSLAEVEAVIGRVPDTERFADVSTLDLQRELERRWGCAIRRA